MLGINKLQFGDIYYSDNALLAEVVKQTQPPESANLTVENQILKINGTASIAFHNTITEIASNIEGLSGISLQGLSVTENEIVKTSIQKLNNKVFNFSWRTRLTDSSEAELENFANELKSLGSLLEDIQQSPEIILTGFTDDSGSGAKNQDLQLERALYVKGRFVGLGVKPNWLFVKAGQNQDQVKQNGATNAEMRKVELLITNSVE